MKRNAQQAPGPGLAKESLELVFNNSLTEVYFAQKQLGSVYQELAEAAEDPQLRIAFEGQVQNTALQVTRVERCFEILRVQPADTYADVVSGLVESAERALSEYKEGPVRDAALIAAAQRIEHFGISAYGSLRTMATLLGRVQCAEMIEENKDEEAETDKLLTQLAIEINQKAMSS